ncbi:hypothetical protein ACF0H5_012158 [Mactra antiquata]
MALLDNHSTGIYSEEASSRHKSLRGYPAAVWGREINKSYSKLHVLNNLNITVPRGSIYGLLGPSGCGKTTLLRCVIGRLHVDSGHVIVLGDTPGSRDHNVPGSMVGYMPQETALFTDLSISETLKYFGTLHGMTSVQVNARTEFLVDFLTLPEKSRLICQLSGGQMRRVSFAVALLHEPELLILDEPTVGVDPLLRERIWDHLINITSHSHSQVTIILTTHYIEEARQADMVGFMRNGRILAEEEPLKIIEKYQMMSLENVFLKLCQADKKGTPTDLQDSVHPRNVNSYSRQENNFAANIDVSIIDNDDDDEPLFGSIQHSNKHTKSICPIGLPRGRNIWAQFVKNLNIMKRKIAFLLFQFMLPIVEIVLFCVCIGNNPFGLHIAVVNEDKGPLGSKFLSALDNRTIIQDLYKGSELEAAINSVKQEKAWAVISIGQNFSTDLLLRFQGGNISDSILNGSSVKLQMDSTNEQIAVVLLKKITDAFEDFAAEMLKSFSLNPKLASLPIDVLKPIYGNSNATFTEFMAPGVIISITFFLATGLTTLVFIMDKKLGMLDRCYASGMLSFEIMIAHMFTQMLIVIVQVAILLTFALLVFKVPILGPLIWVIILVLIQGFLGMALGVLYSAICNDENSAIQLALGSYFPLLLISGILWPIEAMPVWLRYIGYASPMTYACEAMRCILARGLDITFIAVWRGYLVSSAWCVFIVILGGIILRIKE